MWRTDTIWRKIVFSILVFVFFLAALEGGLRAYFFLRKSWNPPERGFSEELGWETEPNAHSKRRWRTFGLVDYSTVRDGFRVYGDPETDKTKLFVIGDSTTQASMISDGGTYYDYLAAHHPGLEIFAYGCAGFGSLQEYMILDRHFDAIRPDLVIWQYDENDFYNNYRALEFESLINNNRMKRPYWENGTIRLEYPGQTGGTWYNLLQGSSLVRLIGLRLDFLKAKNLQTIDDRLTEEDVLFQKAREVTTQIMARVKARVGDTPVVAFGVMDHAWAEGPLREITEENGMRYIPGINAFVMAKKSAGVRVDFTPDDTHWTGEGHAFTGELILDYLVKNGFVEDPHGLE